jgi:hypothetical protein
LYSYNKKKKNQYPNQFCLCSNNLFSADYTKIKESSDLTDLPHIETQEISVNILPFWGDKDNFVIGITRQDFRIRATISGVFTIFGSCFTDGDGSAWGSSYDDVTPTNKSTCNLYRISAEANYNLGISSKRNGKITEKIYYYPPDISDDDIDNDNLDSTSNMRILDSSDYSSYKRDGNFIFIINCNRKRVTKNEFGISIPIDYNSNEGIFTEFKGFVVFEISEDDLSLPPKGDMNKATMYPLRYKFKFPQHADLGGTFRYFYNNENDDLAIDDNRTWRKQYFTFERDKFYSISRFNSMTYMGNKNANNWNDNVILDDDRLNAGQNDNNTDSLDVFFNVGSIQTNDNVLDSDDIERFQLPSNYSGYADYDRTFFGGNWLNFSIYFPQLMYMGSWTTYTHGIISNTNFTFNNFHLPDDPYYYYRDNTQDIAANETNTKWFARSDINWTDFIEVPKSDILKIMNITTKGFKYSEISGNTTTNISGTTYRNGVNVPDGYTEACPYRGGYLNANSYDAGGVVDPDTYFFKGLGDADCFEYLSLIGVV